MPNKKEAKGCVIKALGYIYFGFCYNYFVKKKDINMY